MKKELKILEITHKNKYNAVYVNVLCHCGTLFNTQRAGIRNESIKSCGCGKVAAAKRVSAMYSTTHGGSGKNYLYYLWIHIKARCFNKNSKDYVNYGGRGITMYNDWIKDFAAFREYIIGNLGERTTDKHSLDRIDNNGNYEPNNIRWATRLVQNNNKRRQCNVKNVIAR